MNYIIIIIIYYYYYYKSAIICSPRTHNFQSIPLTICNKQYSYFCTKQIKESINGIYITEV